MKITSVNPDRDPDTGKLKILVEINADDSLILEQSLKEFFKYDKDDPKYTSKLTELKTRIHELWALLHPS